MGEAIACFIAPYLRGRVKRGEVSVLTGRNDWIALRDFAEACGERDPTRISRRDVERWLETYRDLAPGTRRGRFLVVRAFCERMVEQGVMRRNPFHGMKTPREPRRLPRALPAESVARTLAACPDVRARLIVTLMVQEGLRRVEVSRLEVGDIDMAYGTLRVVGKGDHERVLPITDETRQALRDYLGLYPSNAGPLVRSYQYPTRGLHPDTVARIVRTAMEEAGVKALPRDGVTPHALRHTCAADMLRGGANVRDVQAALGHAHLSTTELYLPHLVAPLAEAMGGRSYADDVRTPSARSGA